jgi:DNA-binding SARP family transcriptional activator/TolB-like protein/class 3 adenylate cyclase
MPFNLRLLGSVRLDGEDGPLRGRAAHRRRLAILTLLAASPGRSASREKVIGYLWPDATAEAGRHLLAESLYVIRKELGAESILTSGEDLSMNHLVVAADAIAFEAALEAGDFEQAVGLYGGPFLDGWYVDGAPEFERWASGERERLSRLYAKAVEMLAERSEEAADWRSAVQRWQILAQHDPLNSRTVLRLMKALDQAGERAAAIRHATLHAALLREEIGAEPDPEVEALAERLRKEPARVEAVGSEVADGTSNSGSGGADERSATVKEPEIQPTATGSAGDGSPSGDRTNASPAALPREEPSHPAVFAGAPPRAPDNKARERRAAPTERRIAAVCSVDIVGHTHRESHDPEGAGRVIQILGAAAERELEDGAGRVVDFIGDAVLAEFATAEAAVRAVNRLLREFEHQTRLAGLASTLRIGIDFGEIAITPDGGYYGDAVTAASRLQEEARAGSIFVSAPVRARLRGAPGIRFVRRGVRALHRSGEAVEIFEIREIPPLAPTGGIPEVERRREGLRSALRGSPHRAYLAVALLIAATGMVWLLARGRSAPTSPPSPGLDPNRIAVLYLDDHSANQELDYLAKGLTERVISELSEVRGLNVISRNGVKPFRESTLPIDSIARILRAGSLVGGSIEPSGGRLRVTVQLIDGATGAQLQSRTIERTIGERFALEDDLAEQVARFLRWRLGRELSVRRHAAGTNSLEARDLLLRAAQAREDAAKRAAGPDPLEARTGVRLLAYADSLLMGAEAQDPEWVEPITLRGWVALDRAWNSAAAREAAFLREAISHAERALRSRPRDPAALEVRGTAAWRLTATSLPADTIERLVDQARQDLSAAVQAEPMRASAWSTLSVLLRFQGDFANSYYAVQQALSADAYLLSADEIHERLYRSTLALARYDLARQHCDAGRRNFPADPRFVDCQLTILARDPAARPDVKAATALQRALARMEPVEKAVSIGRPYNPVYREMMVAAVLARAGQSDSARAVLARARERIGGDPDLLSSFAYDEAYVKLLLGNRDEALRALARHLSDRAAHRAFIAHDVLFTTLHRDPRFAAVVSNRGPVPQ